MSAREADGATSVVLCDDHPVFASALAWALDRRGFEICAVLHSPDELAAVVSATRPDVCLVDLEFPGADPIGALEAVVARTDTNVVVLTGYADDERRARALEAGAVACVEKTIDLEGLVGLTRVARDAAPRRPRRTGPGPAASSRRADGSDALSLREREVLVALTSGEPTHAIAARLGVAPATVRTHVGNVLRKLSVHSRAAAVAWAVEHGIVHPLALGPGEALPP